MKKLPRIIVDAGMIIAFLIQFSSQITGRTVHEYSGMTLVALAIIHIIFNRKWLASLGRGKYTAARTFRTALNLSLLACFLITGISGMLMSTAAVPFLYQQDQIAVIRLLHLAFSHWTLLLAGIHMGMHMQALFSHGKNRILFTVLACMSVYGIYEIFASQVFSYMFFQVEFAFLDYEAPALLVFFRNLCMIDAAGMITACIMGRRQIFYKQKA